MMHSRFGQGLTLSLAVVIACGMPASAAPTADARAIGSVERASAQAAFDWQARDAGLLDRPLVVTETFVAQPGLKERSGRVVAKVRDAGDMALQIAREAGASPLPVNPRGVQGVDAVAMARDLAAQRITQARARLAPATVEWHRDIDIHSFTLPAGWTEEEVAALLMATGDYEYVEPDWLVYPTDTTPNDPQFSNQWHHRAQNMNTVRAWDYVTGGPDIIVAVCDTGVRKSHPDLTTFAPGFNATTNLAEVNGGNTDDPLNGHGTLVAGTMAARTNNGVGVAGVGWNFTIMPIRVSDRSDGTALISDIMQGARWAADNGAFAVNASYGGSNTSQANSAGGYIRNQDALLVFSSGNDGVQDQNNDWDNVTIVGASTASNQVANFSNYGPGVDVVAPGVSIRSTTRTGGYSSVTGTSFAAPLTAATLALIRVADPTLTAAQVEQVLFDSVIDIGAIGEDIFAGRGMVDAGGAVETALFGPSTIDLPFTDGFSSGSLSNLWRQPVGTPEVNDNTGGFALNLDAQDSITTVGLRTSFLINSIGEISFGVQHRGVEAGESLLIEYTDIVGNWQTLQTVVSDGVDGDAFDRVRIAVPLLGLHEELKLRFSAQGSDTGDDWYIDDVLVAEFAGNTLPWQTGFEDGIDTTFDWQTAQATASTDASNTPEGDFSARLSGPAVMVTRPIDITMVSTVPYVRLRTQHTGVEAGESLTVEYRDIIGNWQQLAEIVSDGSDQTVFDLHQFPLPFDAFGPELVVRITSDASDSGDVWYIDDVAVTEEFVTDGPTCPQDIDGNGLLNFFDISGFLNLFGAQDPSTDWDGNGLYNFFDISSYLADYNAGCP